MCGIEYMNRGSIVDWLSLRSDNLVKYRAILLCKPVLTSGLWDPSGPRVSAG